MSEKSLLRYWLPPVLWMGVIFILSAQPSLPEYPDTLLDLILKKSAHIMEYGLLAFLLWRALSPGRWGALSRSALVTAFLVSVLYALSDEYHQTFVPGRHGRLMDVGIDAVGALVALLVVGRLRRRKATER
jgi:VanZ family protein